ncbi:MAG: hypothetical protein F6J97_16170 [Leptolyngbya sp. SIO4C1]|nr:hypothetical protein [Leptolyngbya sp. SIO4C1]
MPNLVQLIFSLTATFLVSFLTVLSSLGLLIGLLLIGQLSPLDLWFESGFHQAIAILQVFGSGDVWQGALTVGLTAGLVSGLFDAFAFYKYQSLRQ